MNAANENIAFLNQEEIKLKQLDMLRETLNYVQENSTYYQNAFTKAGVNPKAIGSIDDFKKLPFTTKDDLANNADDFVCIDRLKIADFTSTSGTTAEPVNVPLSFYDVSRLAYNEYQSFKTAGCTSDDVFQLSTTMDKRFMAGMAYYEGVRKLGAGLIRVGTSSPALQWDSILRYQPTVLIAIPSFVVKMLEYAESAGIDPNKTGVKKIIAIGQPIRKSDFSLNGIGKGIVSKWDVQLYSTYASTEMATAFTECNEGIGGHLQPDLVYAELLDEDGNEVKDGELGELVITTFAIEALPLIRFKTGDMLTRYSNSCNCGRNTLRLGPVIGRKNQRLKINGTTVHPSTLIPMLDAKIEPGGYLIELTNDAYGQDAMALLFNLEQVSEQEAEQLCREAFGLIRYTPSFKMVSTEDIKSRMKSILDRKPIKIIDSRKLEI